METYKEGITLAAILLFGKDSSIMSVMPPFKMDAIYRVEIYTGNSNLAHGMGELKIDLNRFRRILQLQAENAIYEICEIRNQVMDACCYLYNQAKEKLYRLGRSI